jgi:RhoGEF domain
LYAVLKTTTLIAFVTVIHIVDSNEHHPANSMKKAASDGRKQVALPTLVVTRGADGDVGEGPLKRNDGITSSQPLSPTVRSTPKPYGRTVHEKRWNILDNECVDLPMAERTWDGKMEFGTPPRLILNLQSFPTIQVKRQEVIHELLLTEMDYCEDLQIIIGLYMKNMRTLKIINEDDIKLLFSNLEALLPLSRNFIERLKGRKRKDIGVIKEIGDIVLDMAEQFKIYHVYCSNFTTATEFLQKRKAEPEFTSLLQVLVN